MHITIYSFDGIGMVTIANSNQKQVANTHLIREIYFDIIIDAILLILCL